MPRSVETVREDARAWLTDAVDRALSGDREALDRLWTALPPSLATEITAYWHYARAARADERRR